VREPVAEAGDLYETLLEPWVANDSPFSSPARDLPVFERAHAEPSRQKVANSIEERFDRAPNGRVGCSGITPVGTKFFGTSGRERAERREARSDDVEPIGNDLEIDRPGRHAVATPNLSCSIQRSIGKSSAARRITSSS